MGHPAVEKLTNGHVSGLNVGARVDFRSLAAQVRAVHRDEYREPHAISGVVFHLRRGPGRSPRAQEDFPRLRIWPFIALLPWARFAFGLQAPISTCVISAFAERTVYITAASVRFPRLRLRIPRTLHALEQNLSQVGRTPDRQ